MSFKICVLLFAIYLFQVGQTLRFANNKNEDINEGTVRMIQNVFKEKYPQEAIDKYISVMRQLYSKNPEEKEQGNFEAVVLLVEGALYRTESERLMRSGNVGIYDVRSALERLEEASNSENDSMELTGSTIEQFKTDLATEFPSEVGELIGSIFMRAIKAETLAEQKKAAIQLTILSMDGARRARVVANKELPTFVQ